MGKERRGVLTTLFISNLGLNVLPKDMWTVRAAQPSEPNVDETVEIVVDSNRGHSTTCSFDH